MNRSLPSALLLLASFVIFTASQARVLNFPERPFDGRASFLHPAPRETKQWSLVVDPRGWTEGVHLLDEHLASFSKLTDVPGQMAIGHSPTPLETPKNELFQGGPRLVFRHLDDNFKLRTELYQDPSDPLLLSGPVSLNWNQELVSFQGEGVNLDALKQVPRNAERVVLVDTLGLELSRALKERLAKAWKAWEFEPFLDFPGAVGSPACYLRWQQSNVFLLRVLDWTRVQRLINNRFPSQLIQRNARWVAGTRIEALFEGRQPGWYQRGDYMLFASDRGIEVLGSLLEERFLQDSPVRTEDRLQKRLEVLASSQKGWHIALIERPSAGVLHWALLLRWPHAGSSRAEGFLILNLRTKGQEKLESVESSGTPSHPRG